MTQFEFNPIVLVFWLSTTLIGYLFNHTIYGAIGGLIAGLTASLVVFLLDYIR